MQTLGNIVIGAILAGISLGPTAWADARLPVAPMTAVTPMVAGTGKIGASLNQVVADVRAALPHPSSSARLHN